MSDLASSLAAALGRPVTQLAPVSGGDLNDAFSATQADGARVFVKTSADPAAAGSFAAEAAGLRWLAEADALPVPDVLAVADPVQPAAGDAGSAGPPPAPRFLVLAWIDAAPSSPGGDEALGCGLAQLHAAGAPSFGGSGRDEVTLRIGPLTLPNAPAADWPAFYTTCRLEPLARLAHDRARSHPRRPPCSTGSSIASTTSPAHRSRPPASTATCGPATSSPTAISSPG